jgi:hypothetical protein
MPLPTLLDVAKRNAADPAVGLIDEASRMVPELSGQTMIRGQMIQIPNVGAARTIKGTQYRTLVRTGLPTAGFRSANNGVDADKSTYINKLVECFILNPRWECDVAVANANEDGPQSFIAEEAMAITNAAMMALGKQFYYGRDNGGHAEGHPGLIDAVDSSMVVDATGNTAATGSSVWAVSFGPQKVQWVLGENGSLDLSDVRIETILGSNSKRHSAFVQEILAWVGVQVGNIYSIGRVKNLTAQNGKTLTPALLGSLVAKFPVGYRPDALFMSRRSLEQWRSSLTATNATGAEAPTPLEYEGIPVIATDSILDTETIA